MEAQLKRSMDALSVFRHNPNFRSSGFGSFSRTSSSPGLTASRSSTRATCSFTVGGSLASSLGNIGTTSKCNTPALIQQDYQRRQEDQKRQEDKEKDEKIRKLIEEVERLKQKEKEQEARIK